MKLFDKAKNVIGAWPDIALAQKDICYLDETSNSEPNTTKDRMWMRGDPEEFDEFYKQLECNNSYFQAVSPRIEICKTHSGLPSLMVQVLTDIVIRDLNSIEVEVRQTDWDSISKNNNFNEILRKTVKEMLFIGDGAFRTSSDKKLTRHSTMEFVPGDKVEIVYERGRFAECVFKTEYKYAHKRYAHYGHYGKGYIKNVLTEWGMDDPLPLSTIPQTANIIDVASADYKLPDERGKNEAYGRFATAASFKIRDSTEWENRGESIFDKKTSSFDGLDETISQWVDAVRAARTKQYTPEAPIPRDPETGRMLQFNRYDDRLLTTEGNMKERSENQINVAQPVIPSENYLQSYISFLDLCLQGVISPSTLGIDTKKMDNAEHREEKKKPRYIQEILSLKRYKKYFLR